MNVSRQSEWVFFIDDRPIEDLTPEERQARFDRQIGPCIETLSKEEITVLRRAYMLDK